jgi:hypothetical protein
MENLEVNTPNENPMMINSEMNSYLLEVSKWGQFLAIVGYVAMGLLVIVAFVMMFALSAISKVAGSGFPMVLIGLLYILLAVLYYFPVTYLYKFSVQTKQAIQMQNESLLTSGFQNLKSMFKFLGILTIVMLSLYGLSLLIAVPIAMLFK